jgi:hypothetical protein
MSESIPPIPQPGALHIAITLPSNLLGVPGHFNLLHDVLFLLISQVVFRNPCGNATHAELANCVGLWRAVWVDK